MPKKVFISYAWEDDVFSEKILSFSNKLRENGIDAIIDQYEENPDMGWPIWMEQQIEESDFVLIVATKSYMEKYKQCQQGKGVSWEISSIYQSLYDLQGHNNKFIPIVFNNEDKQYILKALQPYTNYNIETQFQKLVNRIKGITNVVKPPVNDTPLQPKARKTMFVSPINITLWDKAKWKGVVFLYLQDLGNVLGLMYEGDKDSAVQIFEDWKKYENIDDHIDICFIEGDIEELPPNGYTCLISPNVSKTVQQTKEKMKNDMELVMIVSRFQRMYPSDNFAMFNRFKEIAKLNAGKPVPILPVTVIDKNKPNTFDNLYPHFDKIVFIKNVRFKNASDIKRFDVESCVIPKYNINFPISHKK